MWSDESKFELFGRHRRQYVAAKPIKDTNPSLPMVKHDENCAMVWGSFSYAGISKIVKIEEIMKKEQYCNIRQRYTKPSGTQLIDPNFVFQQDNDSKYTSRYCTDYFERKQRDCLLKIIKLPLQSLDLNPIELL